MLYLASNWEKNDCGNFQYGDITYVINPIYDDKFFVAPYDTGAYAGKSPCPLGTLVDFNHVMVQHLATYSKQYSGYGLATMYKRWYGGGPPAVTGNNFLYFEIEWSGSSWLPESLLYVITKFSEMWSKSTGRALQDWLRAKRRPLIWADGNDSGMLMDPYVDWYGRTRCSSAYFFLGLRASSFTSVSDSRPFSVLYTHPSGTGTTTNNTSRTATAPTSLYIGRIRVPNLPTFTRAVQHT
jgi:hypothetical protein